MLCLYTSNSIMLGAQDGKDVVYNHFVIILCTEVWVIDGKDVMYNHFLIILCTEVWIIDVKDVVYNHFVIILCTGGYGL